MHLHLELFGMLKENGVENCNENIKHNVRIQYLAIITGKITNE